MNIQSLDLLGNSSIGIFGFTTDTYSLFPHNIQEDKQQLIMDTLGVPVINTTLNNSNLVGLFAVGNSKNLVLPNLIGKFELNTLQSFLPEEVEIHVLDSTITALGNVIVTNDDKSLVSSEFSKQDRQFLSDALDTEIVARDILNSTIVGSLIFGNQNGLLAHPLISDEDLDFIEEFFRIPVDVVTVNRGTPYPRPGIIGNSGGVLVGSDTTGPELMRIFDVLLN